MPARLLPMGVRPPAFLFFTTFLTSFQLQMMYQNGSELVCRHFDSRLGGATPIWHFSLTDGCPQL